MKSQTLLIPGELTTMNKLINHDRSHWAIGAKHKKDNTNFVADLCLEQHIKPTVTPPDFDIIFYRPNKRTEKDNCLSQVKEILDGLVVAGVISDDRWDNIGGMSFDWGINKDNPHIEVHIIEN